MEQYNKAVAALENPELRETFKKEAEQHESKVPFKRMMKDQTAANSRRNKRKALGKRLRKERQRLAKESR